MCMSMRDQYLGHLMRRPWFLLIALAVLLLGSFIIRALAPFARQYSIVRRIERAGNTVITAPRRPEWIRKWLGVDWVKGYDNVEDIGVVDNAFNDVCLSDIVEIKGIQHLALN